MKPGIFITFGIVIVIDLAILFTQGWLVFFKLFIPVGIIAIVIYILGGFDMKIPKYTTPGLSYIFYGMQSLDQICMAEKERDKFVSGVFKAESIDPDIKHGDLCLCIEKDGLIHLKKMNL